MITLRIWSSAVLLTVIAGWPAIIKRSIPACPSLVTRRRCKILV
jgi:hypothetical protein